jgi:hypothetical protein
MTLLKLITLLNTFLPKQLVGELFECHSLWLTCFLCCFLILSSHRCSLAEDLLETVRGLPPGSGAAADVVKLQQTLNDVLSKISDLRNHLLSATERLDRLNIPGQSRELETINNKVINSLVCIISLLFIYGIQKAG